MMSSLWKIAFDQSMTFHKVLPEQWQTLRVFTPMGVDTVDCATGKENGKRNTQILIRGLFVTFLEKHIVKTT